MTLNNLVINLGSREFAFGIGYVAFSRISDVSSLSVINFTAKRF